MNNNSGYITASALTPYLTTATASTTYQPIGNYLTTISGLDISQLNNNSGYITGITSIDVTTALGYTPYDSSNPSGFITSIALSPYLTSETASNTYQLRGNYLTTISGLDISQLNNNSGYITGITFVDVTTALGYTPYSDTNPSGYITAIALSPYLTTETASITYQPIGNYLTTIKGLNISELNNDSGYITATSLSDYALLSSPTFVTNISTPIVQGVGGLLQLGSINDRTSTIVGSLQNWETNFYQGDILSSEISSEAISFGQLCYRNSFGKWALASANTSGSQSYNMLGICLTNVGASDESISILTKGYVETTYLSSGGVGDPLYMGTQTSGTIISTLPTNSGNVVRLVGNVFWNNTSQANNVWILYFNPDNTWIEL